MSAAPWSVVTVAAALAISAAACASDTGPVEIVIGQDACASCRMVFTSVATAAELVTPGETPLLFDDLGCLRDYLREHPLTADVALYVREHRQQTWIDGRLAEYSQTTDTSTPMASGIVAHVDGASQAADLAAAGARRLDAVSVIGSGARGRP